MTNAKRKIDVDSATADVLEARAAEQGLTISEFIAELANAAGPLQDRDEDIVELDRRWAAAKADGTHDHQDVVRWLKTWGTREFKRWPSQ